MSLFRKVGTWAFLPVPIKDRNVLVPTDGTWAFLPMSEFHLGVSY